MVNLGFSVLKSPKTIKETKLDPPALKTPPLSPDDSLSSPPSHVVIRNHIVEDEYRVHRLVPNVSLISEITFPQTPDLANKHEEPQQQQHDPPGASVRGINADLEHEFRLSHTSVMKKDPPANLELNTTMSQSIVTRVLGIVDIGCVGPFTERENVAQSPPRIPHHKVEWGIPPTESVISGTDYLEQKTEEQHTYYRSRNSLSDEDVVVCVTPDENQQAHLQLEFRQQTPIEAKVSHPTLENPPRLNGVFPPSSKSNSENDNSSSSRVDKKSIWSIKKVLPTMKDTKKEKNGVDSQKVETILGIVPFADVPNKIDPESGLQYGQPVSKRNADLNQEEKKEDERPRSRTRALADVSFPETNDGNDAKRENNVVPNVMRTRAIIKEPVIEPAEYRQAVQTTTKPQQNRLDSLQKVKQKPGSTSITAKLFRKAQVSPTKSGNGTTLDEDNKLNILKSGGKRVIEAFQPKKKSDIDYKTVDSTVSDSQHHCPIEKDTHSKPAKGKSKTNSNNGARLSEQAHVVNRDEVEETQTRFVPATEADDVTGNGTPRFRKVLKSIKTSSKLPLETVDETAEDDLSSTSGQELRVRIPGIHRGFPDAYISDRDLIGDEYVEEMVEIASYISPLRPQYSRNDLQSEDKKAFADSFIQSVLNSSPGSAPVNSEANETIPKLRKDEIVENKTPERESRGRVNLPSRIRSLSPPNVPNKSWKDFLGISASPGSPRSNECEAVSSSFDVQDPRQRLIYRNNSAPQVLKTIDYTRKPSKKIDTPQLEKEHKPMWRAVIDPQTGRTYFYHRQTRQTTWTKPPDHDIVPSKSRKQIDESETTLALTSVQDASGKLGSALHHVPSERDEIAAHRNPTSDNKLEMVPILSHRGTHLNATVTEKVKKCEENVLVERNDLSESKPFDEPIPLNSPSYSLDDDALVTDEKNSIGPSIALSRTLLSLHSGVSGNFSSGTQTTQLIRNTATQKSVIATATQESPRNKAAVSPLRRRFPLQNNAPIPKNIPVPRSRELTVEEFTTRDPVFGAKDSDIRERKARAANRHRLTSLAPDPAVSKTAYFSFDQSAYVNNNDKNNEIDKDAASFGPTVDTVSALSEADLSFITLQESLEMTRRRALHEALAQKDWDRAADISETMRMDRIRQVPDSLASPASIEWTQGPVDRFVSENDFDGIAIYIAQMRTQDLRNSRKNDKKYGRYGESNKRTDVMHSYKNWDHSGVQRNHYNPGNMYNTMQSSKPGATRTRLGASSQLQHTKGGNNSHSSYSSRSSYTSEYSSASYCTEEEDEDVQRLTTRVARRSGNGFFY